MVACLLLAASSGASRSSVGSSPGKTRIRHSHGKFVPVPDSIPHVEGAYVDRRIRDDLHYITNHFKVLVVEGFAGRLPSGRKVGCPKCHVSDSEHKIGLGVDLVPRVGLGGGPVPRAAALAAPRRAMQARSHCDRTWHGINRLAKWAEPHQNEPNQPFRWVGYNGDVAHGCGDHLHLSWTHDPDYRKYRPSKWVEIFR